MRSHATRIATTLALMAAAFLAGIAVASRPPRSVPAFADLPSTIAAGEEFRCADGTTLRKLPDHPFFLLPFTAESVERWEVIPDLPAEGAIGRSAGPRAPAFPQPADGFSQGTKKPR